MHTHIYKIALIASAAAISIASPALANPVQLGAVNNAIDNSGDQIIRVDPRIDNSGDQIIDVSPDLDLTNIAGARSGDVSSVNDNASSASGNATSVSYSSNYRQSAATAIAPTMLNACGSSASAAGSGRSFSAALGIPFGQMTCQRIQLAGALIGMGATAAGCELLSQDKRVREAFEASGQTCAALVEGE